MREKLIIRLPKSSDQPVRWIHQPADEATIVPEKTGSISDLAAAVTSGVHITLLAPATETLLTQAKLPALKSSRLQQIAGYALEESLSEEVGRVHFAVGSRSADGVVPVAVIGRRFMDDWSEASRDAGLRPHEIIPEVLSLPLADNEWTLLLEPQTILVRTGATQGFMTDFAQLGALMALAWEQTEPSSRPSLFRIYPFCSDAQKQQALSALPSDIAIEVEPLDALESPLQLMIREPTSGIMNFLSGDYSLHREIRKLWLPWREVAVLFGVLLAVHLLFSLAQLHDIEQIDTEVREQQRTLFQAALPEVTTIRYPRRQMEAQLQERLKNQTVRSQDFIEFFAPIAGVVDTPLVQIQSINYRSGTLDINLFTPDISSLESFKARFDQMESLEVELRSVVTSNNRAEGTFRLRRKL